MEPEFSSDGRWLAYVCNESGRHEVYERSHLFADPGRMRIVPWKQRLFTGAVGAQEVPGAGTMTSKVGCSAIHNRHKRLAGIS